MENTLLENGETVTATVTLLHTAELLLCGSAQMTELFSAEHRTFFILHSMLMAFFPIFVLLNDPHVRSIIIGL